MYITVLICISAIALSFVIYAFLFRKIMDLNHILSICFVTLAIDIFLFALFPIRDFFFDSVTITALESKDEGSSGYEISVNSVSIYGADISFPEIEFGKWFWSDGNYLWRPESDVQRPWNLTKSVSLKIPAGRSRYIVFWGNSSSGHAEITMYDYSQTIDLYSEKSEKISIELPDSTNELIFKNELYRVICCNFIHFIILLSIILIFELGRRAHIFLKFRNYRYEFLFFIFSLFMIIKNGRYPSLTGYPSSFYLNGYEFGFVKRGLIGELFTRISPYISIEHLAKFKLIFLTLLYFAISIIVGRIIKKQKDDRIRWFFIFLILSLPSTFIFCTDDVNLDVFLYIIFLASSFIISSGHVIWLLPILVFNMLMINETSCTYYLIPILAMITYKLIKYKRKRYFWTIIGCVSVSVPFCLLLFLKEDPRLSYNIKDIILHMGRHAEFEPSSLAIEAETWSILDQYRCISDHIVNNFAPVSFFFLMLLPAAFIFTCIWKSAYRKMNNAGWGNERIRALSVTILSLSCLSAFAPMIFALDFTRYSSFMINAALSLIFFFINDENVQLEFSDIRLNDKTTMATNIIPILICSFYFAYGSFYSTATSTAIVTRVSNFFNNI